MAKVCNIGSELDQFCAVVLYLGFTTENDSFPHEWSVYVDLFAPDEEQRP